MMKIRFVVVFLLGLGGACTAQNSRSFDTFTLNGKTIRYGIQLPSDFDQSKSYPVVIGPSEATSQDDQSFYWRGTQNTFGWILVDFPIYTKSEVVPLMNHLRSKYDVEGGKFHTICFSANSAGIFDLVMRIPHEFHSITGMAGNPGNRSQDQLAKLKGVKVQFVVGDQDSYWMRSAKGSDEKLRQLGVDSQIEIIKNGKHVMKNLVGTGTISRLEKLRVR